MVRINRSPLVVISAGKGISLLNRRLNEKEPSSFGDIIGKIVVKIIEKEPMPID
ncbi:MAG: hypothetical protein AAF960_25250 [Bacteroidota bacterium]